MMINLMLGDCLERMKEIPDGSVDMILTDPPYGTVKGLGIDGWGGVKTDWDSTIDTHLLFAECNRVLRPNGALLLFSQEPYTSHLITNSHPNVPFSYRMTWVKDHFANPLGAKRSPVSYTEDVCAFFKKHAKHDARGFHPLRPYAQAVAEYTGMTKKQMFNDMGHQGACHFMRYTTAQFSMCTERTYNDMIRLYCLRSMKGFREYSDLREEDRSYRESLIAKMTEEHPKVFNLPDGKGHKSNVLEYPKDRGGHHPTQKPVALLEDLIKTYTNEGGRVMDFTMGSGSTGVACANLGRKFIGIEMDEGYFEIARKRIEEAADGRH